MNKSETQIAAELEDNLGIVIDWQESQDSVDEVIDSVPIAVYSEHMEDWDDSIAHKDFILNNTVGLKTGHNGKARYLVTRAPNSVVKHAHCNQMAIERDLITAVFTIKLSSPSKDRVRKLYTIGYGPLENGSRECYTLTGGLRRTKDNAFVLSEQDTFHSIVDIAANNAAIEGITDSVFSNPMGRVKPDIATNANTVDVADSIERQTSW